MATRSRTQVTRTRTGKTKIAGRSKKAQGTGTAQRKLAKTAARGGRRPSARRTIGQAGNRKRQVTGEEIFASTNQKTNIWLREVAAELGAEQDPHKGYLALRAVLQTLRDRLPLGEAVHLGSQLPMLIRGFYYEGWSPSEKPIKYNRQEFLNAVMEYFRTNEGGITAAGVCRAVFIVLQRYVSEGEINQILGALPHDLQSMFLLQDESDFDEELLEREPANIAD